MCVRVHKMSSELTQNPTDILNLNSQDKTMPTLFKQKHQKKRMEEESTPGKKYFFFSILLQFPIKYTLGTCIIPRHIVYASYFRTK